MSAAFKTTTWTAGSDGKDAFGFNMLPAGRADRRDLPEWYYSIEYVDGTNPQHVAGDFGLGEYGCFSAWGDGHKSPFKIRSRENGKNHLPYCVNPAESSGRIVQITNFEYGHSVRCVKD